jgi:hypothetical protein
MKTPFFAARSGALARLSFFENEIGYTQVINILKPEKL